MARSSRNSDRLFLFPPHQLGGGCSTSKHACLHIYFLYEIKTYRPIHVPAMEGREGGGGGGLMTLYDFNGTGRGEECERDEG